MARDMRPGRWVSTPDGVGIVSAINRDDGSLSVDLVHEDGMTVEGKTGIRYTAGVQLLDVESIPASRLNPPKAKLSEPISEEENEAKNAAIARGEYRE